MAWMYLSVTSYFGSFRIRFSQVEGVVNLRRTKPNNEFFRDVYCLKDHLDAQIAKTIPFLKVPRLEKEDIDYRGGKIMKPRISDEEITLRCC
ncbi:hypothetical protein Tco_0823433 [Tanacetum coccineum]|uniref:Uncharacterized protein n=1 Tax=Tanacetum coccineum TaxID=301880 RepID=A0ABQ5AMH6_9ASTR